MRDQALMSTWTLLSERGASCLSRSRVASAIPGLKLARFPSSSPSSPLPACGSELLGQRRRASPFSLERNFSSAAPTSPASAGESDAQHETASPAKKERKSVFLACCDLEKRKRTEGAIQKTKDAWVKKTLANDANAAKTPELYDGPFWFKFWRRKKRPGARG
ncbi:hypothetical protein BESB_044970 [Besnoitia besnoiti]|uniref:Uncharacterized protein n=1 Tax=Besnoitia besnoiti TaxID=94643 RepID=A0A2A9ME88_BESBE|nr:hypothetical protein BESB_044970 [Besnoitia besnoiti]PFH36305.1 hypothetical protein BESB_044970 [Besnoitia besnoiti]